MNFRATLITDSPTRVCPNSAEIIAYARSRGLTDATLEDRHLFGWSLCSQLAIEENGESLLSKVCSESGILWGGGSSRERQIKPERFAKPAARPPGRPLLSYLGCPIAGERYNDQVHPAGGPATVDTMSFKTATEEESRQVVAHFASLGYLCWIEGKNGDRFGGAVFLPKLDCNARYDRDARVRVDEVVWSLEAARKGAPRLYSRIAQAVLSTVNLMTNLAPREMVRACARAHTDYSHAEYGSPLAAAAS